MFAQRPDVGAVGCMLYYPDDTIQHAGVGIGILTLAGHWFKGFIRNHPGYMGRLFYAQDLSAVTAACIMLLMICKAKAHEPLPVYGDGLQIRDWLYVEDHCKAIDLVLQGGRDGEVYNIGGHNERTNLFIVKTIIARLSERLRDPEINEGLIRHVEDRLGHDRRYGIDPAKIKADLGWVPETPFEVGIVKTIDWYLEHPDWVEHVSSGEYQRYYSEMYGGRKPCQ